LKDFFFRVFERGGDLVQNDGMKILLPLG